MTHVINALSKGYELPEILDPGASGSFYLEDSGFVNIVTAGAEARTVPGPSYEGQLLQLHLRTDGGDCTITVTNGYDQQGNTTIVLNDAGDSVLLYAVRSGNNLRWRVLASDGSLLANIITDPGDGNAIPVTSSGVVNLVTTGAETRTLGRPTFEGQLLQFNFQTDGGDCVITCATTYNQTGNNTATFADAGDHQLLQGGRSGANLVWREIANDGAALTTV